jgi:hypothetical protein
MIPKIDSPLEQSQQGVTYGQASSDAHAGRAHSLPMLGADYSARAEIIGHDAAGYAAAGSALQSLDDLGTVVSRAARCRRANARDLSQN